MVYTVEREDEFPKFLKEARRPVLIVFCSENCAPCRALEKELTYLGCDVIKVDVNKSQQVAAFYGVRSVPTTMVQYDEETVEAIVGFKNAEAYKERLRKCGVAV